MTRALVVYCHPLDESFVAAVRDRVLAGLAAGGAEVRCTDLYAAGFDPGFTASDHATHLVAGTDPSLTSHAEDLQWCDTVVLVYPTWWSGQPAMLKGWIDRVWVNGVAWTLPEGANRLKPGLHDIRRLVAVTTHGSPKWINMVEGEAGKRTITRSLRTMCHPRARTTWLAMYDIDTSTDARRAAFLDRVERRLTRLA
jgi:putative NADPH-quinone reductase